MFKAPFKSYRIILDNKGGARCAACDASEGVGRWAGLAGAVHMGSAQQV